MSTPTIEQIARLQAEVRNYQLREEVAKEAHDKAVNALEEARKINAGHIVLIDSQSAELARLREDHILALASKPTWDDVNSEIARTNALRARVATLETDNETEREVFRDDLATAEARAERLADALREAIGLCHVAERNQDSDWEAEVGRLTALADQPAQASDTVTRAQFDELFQNASLLHAHILRHGPTGYDIYERAEVDALREDKARMAAVIAAGNNIAAEFCSWCPREVRGAFLDAWDAAKKATT